MAEEAANIEPRYAGMERHDRQDGNAPNPIEWLNPADRGLFVLRPITAHVNWFPLMSGSESLDERFVQTRLRVNHTMGSESKITVGRHSTSEAAHPGIPGWVGHPVWANLSHATGDQLRPDGTVCQPGRSMSTAERSVEVVARTCHPTSVRDRS